MSRDIPHEALVLVKRMTSDPKVKIKDHWKVCYILFGRSSEFKCKVKKFTFHI